MFYKISLKHMSEFDSCFLFHYKNSSGYCRSVEDAEIYPNVEYDLETQIKIGNIFVPVELIESFIRHISLPYDDTHYNKNSFFVLPNTGDVRKLLKITTLDFHLKSRSSFYNLNFESTIIEKFKLVRCDKYYVVKHKKLDFNMWFSSQKTVKAKTRNEAINLVYKSGDFGIDRWDCNFIEFKSKVVCSKRKYLILDKWVKI